MKTWTRCFAGAVCRKISFVHRRWIGPLVATLTALGMAARVTTSGQKEYAGIDYAARPTSDRVAIVPANYETDAAALRRLLADFDTVILMKVGGVLPRVLAALEELGLLDAAVYAERVGMPEEVIVRDVRALQGQRRPYLSLLIVRRRR